MGKTFLFKNIFYVRETNVYNILYKIYLIVKSIVCELKFLVYSRKPEIEIIIFYLKTINI